MKYLLLIAIAGMSFACCKNNNIKEEDNFAIVPTSLGWQSVSIANDTNPKPKPTPIKKQACIDCCKEIIIH